MNIGIGKNHPHKTSVKGGARPGLASGSEEHGDIDARRSAWALAASGGWSLRIRFMGSPRQLGRRQTALDREHGATDKLLTLPTFSGESEHS
jgi:hypothetical protein